MVPVVPFLPGTGLRTLRIPVCHPDGDGFAEVVWRERLDGVERLLSLVKLLLQAHVQRVLLRVFMNACRVNDLLREGGMWMGRWSGCRGCSRLPWRTRWAYCGPLLGLQ